MRRSRPVEERHGRVVKVRYGEARRSWKGWARWGVAVRVVAWSGGHGMSGSDGAGHGGFRLVVAVAVCPGWFRSGSLWYVEAVKSSHAGGRMVRLG